VVLVIPLLQLLHKVLMAALVVVLVVVAAVAVEPLLLDKLVEPQIVILVETVVMDLL
jgi:hypothetical protein